MPQHQKLAVRCHGVAAVILRSEASQIRTLILRRAADSNGQWCQVSGGIEQGETAWEAALREIKEETNLVPDRLYSADICEQFYEIDKDAIWIAPVFVGFVSKSQDVVLNHEHIDFKWLTVDEAMMVLPFAGQRRVFEHVKREFIERQPNELLRICV